jgi:hypothetical protein
LLPYNQGLLVASDYLEVVKGLKGECTGAYGSIVREVREGAYGSILREVRKGVKVLFCEGILLLSMKEGSLMERRIDWQGLLRPCQAEDMCGFFIHPWCKHSYKSC